jgi:hypothetical protein
MNLESKRVIWYKPDVFICFNLILLFLILSVHSSNICKESYIEDNINSADVVLAGAVTNIERSQDEKFVALVEIHRIIKGRKEIYDLFDLKLELNESKQGPEKKKFKRRTVNGNKIFIYNFGNKQICDSSVKPKDVRIFLLSIQNEQLFLNSSLIQPISKELRNLNSMFESQFSERCKLTLKQCNHFILYN